MEIMNTSIGELLKRTQLLNDTEAWFESFDAIMKRDIVNYIRYDQLENLGIDENEQIIGYYSYATQQISGGRKRAGTPYTLNDTGAFFRSFNVTITSTGFTINADGQKEDKNLFTEYGIGIIGLTESNLEKITKRIKERIQDYVFRILFRH